MPAAPLCWKGRLLKTALTALLLLGAALRADAPLEPAAPPPPPDARIIVGPASVSLGAEASLQLPEGWRFVPVDQLRFFWAASGRRPGAWDRGVLIPQDGWELRFLFEPLGALALEPAPQAEPLLAEAQALALAAGRELPYWRWEPLVTLDPPSLRFGGVWRQGDDETLSMHLRWPGRRGVLKLDWRGAEDDANAFIAISERMEEGLRFQEGQRLGDAQAGDPRAVLTSSALILDGFFGRGAALPAEGNAEGPAWWVLLLAGLAGLGALLAGVLSLWRRLEAWLDQKERRRKDQARLAHLERSFGGHADDVEAIEEDEGGKP